MSAPAVSSAQSPTWVGPLCTASGGVAATVVAPMTPYSMPVGVGGVTAVGLSLVVGINGVRTRRRSELIATLSQSLAHVVGPPDQVAIKARRWRSGFVGAPTRVDISYSPAAKDQDKEWASQVAKLASAKLGIPFEVLAHDPRKNLVKLRARSGDAFTPEVDADRARAEHNVLRLLGPTAKVTDTVVEEGQIVKICASYEEPTRFVNSGHRARLERALTEVMPGRWRGVWQLEKDTVTFEQRPALPESVWVPLRDRGDTSHLLKAYSTVKVPFAVSEDGDTIFWQPSKVPQLLVSGGTGTGKTSTSHSIVSEFCASEWPVWISDAKQVEFLAFRDYPNVQLVATSVEQQVAMIWHVLQLMQWRYKLIETGRARVEQFEPLLVVLDEFTEFRDELLEWYPGVKAKGGESKPPTLKHVARIARKARTARIHLAVLLQRPDAAFLSGEMRSNFGMRASMGRLDPSGAIMMWENAATGVTIPRGKTGRCVSTDETGRVVEAQAYRFPDMDADPDSEQGQLLAQLRPKTSRHERLLITPPEALALEGEELTFVDYATAPLVRAVDHPDWDPLNAKASTGPGIDPAVLGSPSILLDPTARRSLSSLGEAGGMREALETRSSTQGAAGESDELESNYLEVDAIAPLDIKVGDLVLVDADLDVWGVVDLAPEESLEEPGVIEVAWTSLDGSDEGVLSIPEDSGIERRRPVLDADLGEPLPDADDSDL